MLCRYLVLSPHVRLLLRSELCCRPKTVSVFMAHFVRVVQIFTLPLSQMLSCFFFLFSLFCLKPSPYRSELHCCAKQTSRVCTNLNYSTPLQSASPYYICCHFRYPFTNRDHPTNKNLEHQHGTARGNHRINTSDCTKKSKTQQTTTHTYSTHPKTRDGRTTHRKNIQRDICRSTAPKPSSVRFCSMKIHFTRARHTCRNPERRLTYTPSRRTTQQLVVLLLLT